MRYKYIKHISFFLFIFAFGFNANAQLDRTKQPKAGPAPKIELKKPEQFKLDNGLKVMVVENHVLPRVSFTLQIDNNPILEGDKAGVSTLLGAMLGNGTTSITKDKFNEEIDFIGANLNFGSQSAYAAGLSKYSERLVQLMADAAMNPLLTEEEFDKEKNKLLENLKSEEKSVAAAAARVGSALSYGVKHPYGEFSSEESINSIKFQDVLDYYKTYFGPSNAYLVVIGDIDDDKVKDLTKKYLGNWKAVATPEIKIIQPEANVPKTEIDFVDMPNAVQSDITVINNVKLKMSDEDYFPVLIANFILGGGGSGYLYKNLREDKGYTYGAYSRVRDSRYEAAQFSASAEVRNEVTDSAVVETMKEIKRLRTEKVDPETLALAKAKYVGSFVLALERPQTIANYALNIELNDLDDDFYEDYLKKINEVTAEDVMRVANKYFQPENSRIIVVGKGSEVLENLEKTGYPINYYDKYAKKVEKPVFSKPIPEGVTAKSVLDTYIARVGGKDKLSKVNTVYNVAEVSIANVPMQLSAEMKSMAPNMESMEMSAQGMGVLMKQKFDGTVGYVEQQGQKMPLTEVQIAEKKAEKSIFPELYYDNAELESVATVNGKDVYKIKVTTADKPSYRYYDVETGLLSRVESSIEAQGQMMTSTVDFSNYQEVEGIMFPMMQHVESGPQVIDLKIDKVVVNKDVTADDFK
ncbi:Predicted Zn-dependent peptidase [Flavobacteriaceae bacterium MAR_2010_188]|nr:Predicted Zn-dependent peptidase [Flavobacteriaceae bacterium MAR_2010_188]